MKLGDAVFFKVAKKNSDRKTPEFRFQGHAFGILLGHISLFQKDPSREHLVKLLGAAGFLSFDDVGEFLGEENGTACAVAFEDKYWGKKVDESQSELPFESDAQQIPESRPSGLVDLRGSEIPAASPPPDQL